MGTHKYFFNCKSDELGYTPGFFRKMALRGGGHLKLKKAARGIFGDSSAFVWGDVQISFLKKNQFIPCFALMLLH